MKSPLGLVLFIALLVAPAAIRRSLAAPNDSGSYAIAGRFHLGGPGGYGYVALDSERKHLYVPRSTHTQVVDTTSGKVVGDIPGQRSNRGVAIDPASGRGFISDRGEGYVVIFDLKTDAVLGKLPINAATDEIITDSASKRVYLSCRPSQCLLPVPVDVDPSVGKADPVIELGGWPISLVSDGKGKIYVMAGRDIAVIDSKARKVVGNWSTEPRNYSGGLAIDPAHRRLFVGCYVSAAKGKMIVLDTENGRVLADTPISSWCSAATFDNGFVFLLCNDGLHLAKETSPGQFEVIQVLRAPHLHAWHYPFTIAVDHVTHSIYLPAVEEVEVPEHDGRRRIKPDSFEIDVVRPRNSQD